MEEIVYPALQKEIDVFQKRTRKSHEAHQKAMPRLPLGVASNFRIYDPYPIFVKEGVGGHIRDLDGNDYIDFNLCFGALMAGHCNPQVTAAVEKTLHSGTMFGMPHEMEFELADEICKRFPVEQVRFGNSGTEVTMHAIRLARGFTGRNHIIKFEGCYHGVHDSVMVSVKPKSDKWGDPLTPNQVPSSAGVLPGAVECTLVAPFNNLEQVERLFKKHPNQVAALILEPIPMNVGILMPEPGFLKGLRELCTKHGALLIFDEVKTGAKLAYGGACEYFDVKPDIVCLAKSIGGGFPLAAFASSKHIMDVIADHKVFHAGTYNTNPLVMAAGLATFRHVLTHENYKHINHLSKKIVDGHNAVMTKHGISGYCIGAGANGAVMLYPKPLRTYRDWTEIDVDLWKHYWFAMVNRGVLPQAHWWDEQWTLAVVHTEQDVDRHINTFAEVAPELAKAQQERYAAVAR